MAVDYGMSIGFQVSDLILAILLVQFVGFPAAIGFGKLAEKWHPKTAILTAIAVYMGVVIWASRMYEVWEFYVLSGLIGLVQGGVQALSRSFFSRLITEERSGEFYGFYNLLGKFSGIVGPLLMGWVGYWSRSPRMGILSILILFVSGALLLSRVNDPRSSHTP